MNLMAICCLRSLQFFLKTAPDQMSDVWEHLSYLWPEIYRFGWQLENEECLFSAEYCPPEVTQEMQLRQWSHRGLWEGNRVTLDVEVRLQG